MSQGCHLETILEIIGNVGDFEEYSSTLPHFSSNKQLYSYQQEALYNCLKLLSVYFEEYKFIGDQPSVFKKKLMDLYDAKYDNFSWENRIKKYSNEKKKVVNDKFANFVFNRYYEQSFGKNEEYVNSSEFYNRGAFWMATASGKSVVIVKLIDLLSELMAANLIPKKPIMLLTPKDYILDQIENEAREYNIWKKGGTRIIFNSLKEFEGFSEKASSLETNVFTYRSDLIRDKTSENFLSFYDVENDGNWYVILDEAHRGDNDLSLSKGYFTILSRKGFLFNFSATFADEIDYQTTLYNFNLEKFIEQGYGKNIFVSDTLYTFKNNESELDEAEKKKEVLKSFIVYTAVKKTKNDSTYHSPLLMTLVGTVNTAMSDLKIYFSIIEQIASGKIDRELFESAKHDLLENEIHGTKLKYSLGDESLDISGKLYDGKSFLEILSQVSLMSIVRELFNSTSYGKIEFVHSKDIQEIGLKLETSEEIFGLIKIGERDKFENAIISDENNYALTKSISIDSFFAHLETESNINMLCGSRAFYEGWDTNRPNVINLIDIGSKEAKKFVPQAIGRGIRIKPNTKTRKRLAYNDTQKNQLIETLFVFATNKDVLDTIIKANESRHSEEREYEVSLKQNNDIGFELMLPRFVSINEKIRDLPKYNLSEKSYFSLKKFYLSLPYEVMMIKYDLKYDDYKFIKGNLPEILDESGLFCKGEYEYVDMPWLLRRVIAHIQKGSKSVDSVEIMPEDTIRHFKRVRIYYDDFKKKDLLLKKIEKMTVIQEQLTDAELWERYDKHIITREELNKKLKDSATFSSIEEQDDIVMQPIVNHYYLPLIYSKKEDNSHIGSVIKVSSEREYIINLIKAIPQLDAKWYFSKLVENVDEVFIPYFAKSENRWRNFYSDFIFWVKRDEKVYDVYFVDPKGTKITDYEQKVFYYKKFFYNDSMGIPIEFKTENGSSVRFHLRLITDDMNKINISNPYAKFWYSNNDFSFLKREMSINDGQ